MLRQKIYDDVKAAMKAQDAGRLDVVRFLWSEIKNVEIDAKHELDDDEVIALLRTEVKRRREALEQYTKAGRQDLIDHEGSQLQVVESYLPAQMGRKQIETMVDTVMDSGATDFGSVMRGVMSELKGKADGKLVSEVVKAKLGT
jgi:uncharacterized protein YqeY